MRTIARGVIPAVLVLRGCYRIQTYNAGPRRCPPAGPRWALLPPGLAGAWVLRLAPAIPWALSGAPGREDRRLRQRPGPGSGWTAPSWWGSPPPPAAGSQGRGSGSGAAAALQRGHGGPCCLPALAGALGPSSGSGYALGPLRGSWPRESPPVKIMRHYNIAPGVS